MAYVCSCGKETVYDCYDYARNKKNRCPFKKVKIKEYPFSECCASLSYVRTTYVKDKDERGSGPLFY